MLKSQTVEDRLNNEREFHNDVFAEERRASVGRFYETIPDARGDYWTTLSEDCRDKVVLEYGCGPGSRAFDLAAMGAHVLGIDISDVAIEIARKRAAELGVNADFRVMNAEDLELPNRSFDKIVGSGIIHHLDLHKAFSEIARCLRQDGVAAFIEPMGHHPLVNLFRRLTPSIRTVDEHPLVMRDIEVAKRYFGSVKVRYYNLVSMGAGLLFGTFLFKPTLSVLLVIDKAVLTILPFMRRWAWIAVIEMRQPKSTLE